MKVNDIVAIKNGGKLIALVQVIGGAYEVNDDGETDWIVFQTPYSCIGLGHLENTTSAKKNISYLFLVKMQKRQNN